jgi:flagellar basal-body rod protein FlgB
LDLAQTPFFSLLRTRLDQLSERQRLISENIANASTPGYRPRDLDTSSFERLLASAAGGPGGRLTMTRTSAAHMTAGGGAQANGAGDAGSAGQPRIVTRNDSETTIDGNAVILEDEMARAAENRMAYETGIALYQKGLDLMRMAARAPGR